MRAALAPLPTISHARSSGWRQRARADDGFATVSLAAVFPVILLIMLVVIQATTYYLAQEHAQAAAAEGARTARIYNSSAAAGSGEARLLLSQTGGDWLLSNPTVSATRGAEVVSVTVSGTAPSFVPGLTLKIDKTVQAPVERLTAPGGGPGVVAPS